MFFALLQPGENKGKRLGEFENVLVVFTCSRILTNPAEVFTSLLMHGEQVLFLLYNCYFSS